MKRYKTVLLVIVLILFSISDVFAITYFVKSDGNDSLDGKSDNTAWKTIKKVNSFAFKAGDDVYFKCDDSWAKEQLVIDWSGTEGDYVVVGAYYGSGTIGVSGSKPIIDGNDTIPATKYQGLIWSLNRSYVSIENLNIINSEQDGIRIGYGNHINVKNVDIKNCYDAGISYVYTEHGEINGCVIDDVEKKVVETPGEDWGGNITIAQISKYITVKNCVVKNSYGEGILIGRRNEYITVEYNRVYNNRRVMFYIDNARYSVIRYNIGYGAYSLSGVSSGITDGIGIGVEAYQSTVIGSDNYVYGNFIANCSKGIYIGSWHEDSSVRRYYIYNNTVVDCRINMQVWDGPFEDSEVKNNIFWCLSGDCVQASSPNTGGGVDFDYNLWSSTPDVDAIGPHDVIGNPKLTKTSGWRSIKGSEITTSMFGLQPGSPAIGAGVKIDVNSMYLMKSIGGENLINIGADTGILTDSSDPSDSLSKPPAPQNLQIQITQ